TWFRGSGSAQKASTPPCRNGIAVYSVTTPGKKEMRLPSGSQAARAETKEMQHASIASVQQRIDFETTMGSPRRIARSALRDGLSDGWNSRPGRGGRTRPDPSPP